MTNNQAYAMQAEQTNTQAIPFHLIIAAAGSGTRFDETLPKQFWPLCDKTILRRTVERFLGIKGLQSITLVINPEHEHHIEPTIKELDIVHIVNGGKTRKQSIYNAVKSLSHIRSEDIVLIHDAARPFVETYDITAILKSLQSSKAATLCTRVTDTLHDIKTHTYPDRETLKAIQTCKVFITAPSWPHINRLKAQKTSPMTPLLSLLWVRE